MRAAPVPRRRSCNGSQMSRSGSLMLLILAGLAVAAPAHAQQAVSGSGFGDGPAGPRSDTFMRGDPFGQSDPGLVEGTQDEGAADADASSFGNSGSSDAGAADPLAGTAPRGTIDGLAAGAGEEAIPLADTRRAQPIQPFSERLRAVSRRAPLGGGGNPDALVFDGDTTRDAPRGIRLGSFLLYPELYTGLGWSSNRAGDASGSSGSEYRIAPSLRLQSDWSRHSLGVNLRGSYTGYPASSLTGDPNVTADALLRLEMSERTELDVEGSYGLSMEDRGTAESSGGDQNIHQVGAGLALRRQIGLFGAELRGRVDSTHYSGIDGASSQTDRDNALFTGTLRVETNTGATLQPYAEASLLKRRYFDRCDNAVTCVDRDSTGYALRAGVGFDTGGKLSGDLALGWRSETLKDKSLARLEGLTVDGSLVWSPARLTTVTGLVNTTLSPSDIAGTPGSVTYSGDLRIAQGFSDALTGEVGAGYSRTDYAGISLTEQEARATSALTYALTSSIALQGRYTFRRFSSTTPGAGYSASEIEAGLRFRR